MMPRFTGGTFIALALLSYRDRPVIILSPGCARIALFCRRHQILRGEEVDYVENIQQLIGRSVVSLETANKLGALTDVLVDVSAGQLAGFAVRRADSTIALASALDVHGIGPDAVIVDHDQSLVLADASPLNALPRAKQNLVGMKVMTHHGESLGSISNAFLYVDKRPGFIYEVRSSFLDGLLGRACYFAGSVGCTLAKDGSFLVVTACREQMDARLDAAVERLLGPYRSPAYETGAMHIEVRTQRRVISG